VGDGRVISAAAAGVASVLDDRPMAAETACLWFSMTKIVTATVAVSMAEDGELDLDGPVSRHLPAFPSSVLVRHLLQHTAGMANPLPLRWVRPAGCEPPDDFVADLLKRHPRVARAPGQSAKYTNLGYLALGEVIAQAAGAPYEQVVRERILTPLRMSGTGFTYLPDAEAATGHQRRLHPFNPLLHAFAPEGVIGSARGRWMTFNRFLVNGSAYGGLVGPVTDAGRFLAMHANEGELDGERILSAAAARTMQDLTAHGRKLDVGLGWFRRHTDSGSFVEHLGGGAGFWNVMRLYPESGVGVVAMGNATSWNHQQVAHSN
jgi:CubicO group peptidase (beta-lactamase class C family)